MRKTTRYLRDDLHRKLGEVARRERTSQAALVRKAIEAYLAGCERPWPRSIGIGEDPDLEGKDVRDWIRRTWDEHL